MKPEIRLVKVAATLLHGLPGLSSFAEDMPKTTPKVVLARIEAAEEHYRKLAIELAAIANELREARWERRLR